MLSYEWFNNYSTCFVEKESKKAIRNITRITPWNNKTIYRNKVPYRSLLLDNNIECHTVSNSQMFPLVIRLKYASKVSDTWNQSMVCVEQCCTWNPKLILTAWHKCCSMEFYTENLRGNVNDQAKTNMDYLQILETSIFILTTSRHMQYTFALDVGSNYSK